MDGGASVVAFISLALGSADVIRKAISSIKNAPLVLQQTTDALNSLSNLLQQLRNYSASFADAEDLPKFIRGCAEDLAQFEKKLEGFTSVVSKKRINIVWENIKIAFQEKEIDMMNTTIRRHLLTLSLQVSLLEGYNLNL